jgi:hypothetical protein
MSLDRPRPGSAVPEAPLSPRTLRGAGLTEVVWLGTLAAMVVGLTTILTAQLPPPARPPKPAAAATPKPDAPRAAPAKLPSGRSILDRHVAAIGGRAAVLGHKSTHAVGTLAMPSTGLTGALEMYGAHPNKTLLKISLGGVGDVLEGFDGTHGWSLSPMTGPMLLEGRQLEEKRFDSELYSELRSESRYTSVTTLEQVDFEGRPCYKVRLVRKSGGEDLEFYDVATGLKAGSITTRETQMGTVTGTTIESEYRKFGNLLQPTKVVSHIGGLEQVITISSIEYDRVPPSVFDLPLGIKALLLK